MPHVTGPVLSPEVAAALPRGASRRRAGEHAARPRASRAAQPGGGRRTGVGRARPGRRAGDRRGARRRPAGRADAGRAGPGVRGRAGQALGARPGRRGGAAPRRRDDRGRDRRARAAPPGSRVFATGGLGGVHRGARETWDVSADLGALARTPVLTVCSGVKSILDVAGDAGAAGDLVGAGARATAPTPSPGSTAATPGHPVPWRVDDPAQVAAVWRAHRDLGGGAGMVLAQPVPAADELDAALHDRLLAEGLALVAARGIAGKDVTPALLAHFHDGQRRREPRREPRAGAGERGAGRAGRGGAGRRVTARGSSSSATWRWTCWSTPRRAPVAGRGRPGADRHGRGRGRGEHRGVAGRPRRRRHAGRPGR